MPIDLENSNIPSRLREKLLKAAQEREQAAAAAAVQEQAQELSDSPSVQEPEAPQPERERASEPVRETRRAPVVDDTDYRALYEASLLNRQRPLEAEQSEAQELLSVSDVDDDGLSPDEEELLPSVIPVMEKIARQQARAVLREVLPAINKVLSEMNSGVRKVSSTIERTESESFKAKVDSAVPDLATLRKNRAFTDFIQQQSMVDADGITYAHRLNAAYAAKDLKAFTRLVDYCREASKVKKEPVKEQKEVEKFTRPVSIQRPVNRLVQKVQGQITESSANALFRAVARGKVSREEGRKGLEQIRKARSNGLLVKE